ncbi:MAG TPA: hypothetical protein VGO90_00790 [Chthoniobacteraceae bacterium]|jgi:hypothetical protein|nr:hypothetical protein [Chthoniobacteraceae bacterium]
MDESFAAKLIHAAIFLSICAAILWLGWSEPLSYRFMSRKEIAEVEGRAGVRPEPTPNWMDTGRRKLRIEEAATDTRARRSSY